MVGAITGYIDVAQIALYAFWIFFALLLWYIRQEDRREGYPLEHDVTGEYAKESWLFLPSPKTFIRPFDQSPTTFPHPGNRDERPIAAVRTARFAGAPIEPTGNPMKDGVGPAAWTERDDVPDRYADGDPRIVPMRLAPEFEVAPGDPDPRGMAVIGFDRKVAGTVRELWIDRAEQLLRYLEVETAGGTVLVPWNFCKIREARGAKHCVYVHAIASVHFADIPRTASDEQITLLEEDKIMGYVGGGLLYGHARRAEPIL